MRRVVKQYFFLVGVFGSLLFLMFLLHTRMTPLSHEDSRLTKPNYAELNQRMSAIEHEIESQVRDSSIMLKKLKEAKRSNLTIEEQLVKKIQNDREKLAQLHNVLDQEAHVGEVQSGGDLELEKGHLAVPGEEDENGAHEVMEDQSKESVIAVLVFVCNRPTVTRCLDKLIQYRPSKTQFPIILTQDCGHHEKTMEALKPYESELTHIFQPDLSPIEVEQGHRQYEGYYKIARHYGWALNYAFNTLNYSTVAIVEDDIEVAADFFDYFSATLPVLKKDPSLWCVSAWNDNGKANRIDLGAPDLLYRTDFFPGLGWMLTKELWQELGPKWPRGFWDDWMREPEQRKGRACIRPEISRTSTFGKVGVSRGTYYQSHLKFIKLNDQSVKFTSKDLSYLIKENYDKQFLAQVSAATLLNSINDLPTDDNAIDGVKGKKKEYRLEYGNNAQFYKLAKELEIMDDLRAGVPRTAYLGIVSTMSSNHRVYLAPNSKWPGYKS